MLWHQQLDHANLNPCNCDNQSMSYYSNFVFAVYHCKNEFVILTDQLLPQLHLHFQYIVRNMKYEDN